MERSRAVSRRGQGAHRARVRHVHHPARRAHRDGGQGEAVSPCLLVAFLNTQCFVIRLARSSVTLVLSRPYGPPSLAWFHASLCIA